MYSNKKIAIEIDLEKGTLFLFQNEIWDKTKYYEPMHEYNYSDLLYLFVNRYVPESDRERLRETLSLSAIKKHFAENGSTLYSEFLMNITEERVPVLYQVTLLSPVNGKCRGIIEQSEDSDKPNESMSFNAEHDPLTHLLNRNAFDKAVKRALSEENARGAFYMLDIDNFKSINDRFGHTMGDAMLKKTADWMTAILPPNAIIGRFGGDEFVAYVPFEDGDTEQTAKRYGEKIILTSKMVEEIPNFSCSIGVSLYPQHAATHPELFEKADQTLYFVKENGKGGCEIYNNSIPFIGSAVKHKKTGLFGAYRIELFIGTLILVAAASFIFLILAYFDTLDELTINEGSNYLVNMAESTLDETNSKLYTCQEQLHTVEKSIAFIGDHADYMNKLAFLESFENALGCTYIAMLDDSMSWHAPKSMRNLFLLTEYIADNPEAEYCYINFPDGKHQNCFAVLHHTENMVFDRYNINIIAALYFDSDISNILLGKEPMENASVAICSSDGTIEYKHSNCFLEDNVFSFLDELDVREYDTLDKIRLDFLNSEPGFLNFVYNGVRYEGYYQNLLQNGKMFFFYVKLDEINRYANKFLFITLSAFCAVIAFIFLALIGINRLKRGKWKRLKSIAYEDKISGMPTLVKFAEEYDKHLKKDKTPYAIVCVKISNMAYLNSYFGSHVADMLLKYISWMINWSLDENEMLAAVPGAKFFALLRRVEGKPVFRRVGDWLAGIDGGVHVMNRVCPAEIRAGIYNCDDSSEDFAQMLEKAEYALDEAIDNRNNTYVVSFDAAHEKEMNLKKQLSERIDGLIEYGHFKLMLAPYYSLSDGTLNSYAAVLQCQMDGEKIDFPSEYIQPERRTDIFCELSLYALERVCGDLTYLRDNGLKLHKIRCAFSPAVIDIDSYINRAASIILKYGAPKEFISVEVKAQEVHKYFERLEQLVPILNANGIDFLISCYTGQEAHVSEFAELKPKCIKLDASFFVGANIKDDAISRIKAICSAAAEYGIEIAADGVNHKPQADFLAKCGCSYAGGSCFSKAIPVEAVFENARNI